MNEMHLSPLWLIVRGGTDGKRACRDFECTTADGVPIFSARAYEWGNEIVGKRPRDPLEPVFTLRQRRLFPVSGKVDILGPDGRPLGVVQRNGQFSDAAGVDGRFQDVRTVRGKAAESLLSALTALALGGEAETGMPPGFMCLVGDRPVGSLVQARAPWLEQANAGGEGRLRRVLNSSIARLRAVAGAESTWKLERTNDGLVDPRVLVAAALYMVELSRR